MAATSSSAGTRNNDARSHEASPRTATSRSAERSASATVCTCTPPLCTTARRKSPDALGVPNSVETLKPPADSPKTVTLCGSPPNAAMLSCTQRQGSQLVAQAPVPQHAVLGRPGRGDRETRGLPAGS